LDINAAYGVRPPQPFLYSPVIVTGGTGGQDSGTRYFRISHATGFPAGCRPAEKSYAWRVDLAHAAGSERGKDFIRAELLVFGGPTFRTRHARQWRAALLGWTVLWFRG
jgi:hypothetical protein